MYHQLINNPILHKSHIFPMHSIPFLLLHYRSPIIRYKYAFLKAFLKSSIETINNKFPLTIAYYLQVKFKNDSYTRILRLRLRVGCQKWHRWSFNFGLNSGFFLWCRSVPCRGSFLFHRFPLWLISSLSWWWWIRSSKRKKKKKIFNIPE